MRPLLLKTIMVLALAACGHALADPPTRVGRISLAEGEVALRHDDSEEAGAALLNWPVTSDSRIVTERGAMAEFRVGSAAVRLAGDSELEVTRLDDDNFRLRLNYGSVGVRIASSEMLPGFELQTDLARVTLTQPGRLRVDARRDASVVGLFSGRAEVEGAGSALTLTAGKRVSVANDEMRLGALRRDAFDDWLERPDGAAPAARYVSEDVTGYEELERYGNWSVDPEYGPLWQPAALPAGWAPYRDGRWIWLQPWGWTWVDNAPWGYAPSHYGRWVQVRGHWRWAPGQGAARPAWSPAMVGWVGGAQVTFAARDGRRSAPGVGWFPLTPHDSYVPPYRVSSEYQRRLDWGRERDAAWRAREREREREQQRDGRAGLTVVPGEQFRLRGTVPVSMAPRAVIAPGVAPNLPLAAPPAPALAPATQVRRGGEAPRAGDANSRPDQNSRRPDGTARRLDLNGGRPDESARRPDANPGRTDANPVRPDGTARRLDLNGVPPEENTRRPDGNPGRTDGTPRRLDLNGGRPDENVRRPDGNPGRQNEPGSRAGRQDELSGARPGHQATARPGAGFAGQAEPAGPAGPATVASGVSVSPRTPTTAPAESRRGQRQVEPAYGAEPGSAQPGGVEPRERPDQGYRRGSREPVAAPLQTAPSHAVQAQPAPLQAVPSRPPPAASIQPTPSPTTQSQPTPVRPAVSQPVPPQMQQPAPVAAPSRPAAPVQAAPVRVLQAAPTPQPPAAGPQRGNGPEMQQRHPQQERGDGRKGSGEKDKDGSR